MLRKLLLVLIGSMFITPAFAYMWYVPGHYENGRYIGGHMRGQAGYLAPHMNYNYRTGNWHYIPGHYTNP